MVRVRIIEQVANGYAMIDFKIQALDAFGLGLEVCIEYKLESREIVEVWAKEVRLSDIRSKI